MVKELVSGKNEHKNGQWSYVLEYMGFLPEKNTKLPKRDMFSIQTTWNSPR